MAATSRSNLKMEDLLAQANFLEGNGTRQAAALRAAMPQPIIDPRNPRHTIDPETGIWPISEWGFEALRGFISNERFARPGDKVIPRTNRAAQRKRT
jgi:hypothetical protein